MTATAEETRAAPPRAAFTVELGDDFGRNIHIATLAQTFRGNWSLARMQRREMQTRDGGMVVIGGRNVGDEMSRMPEIPGIRLRLEPKDRRLTITDPYEKNPEAFALATKRWDDAQHVASPGNYKPMKELAKVLDEDTFKTLCKEVAHRVNTNAATVVQGVLPSMAEIDALPGDYLFDVGNSGDDHPRYEKDVAAWKQRLAKL